MQVYSYVFALVITNSQVQTITLKVLCEVTSQLIRTAYKEVSLVLLADPPSGLAAATNGAWLKFPVLTASTPALLQSGILI